MMAAEQDYLEDVTLSFVLKFEHSTSEGIGSTFQKEFSIEHHKKTDSRHTRPHVQLHIHGPETEHKVGKIWITLPLRDRTDYDRYIKGFFYLLRDVIDRIEPRLDEQMLNVAEVEKLEEEKRFLLGRIDESLKTEGIEYKPCDGEISILTPDSLPGVLESDKNLLPFFGKKEK